MLGRVTAPPTLEHDQLARPSCADRKYLPEASSHTLGVTALWWVRRGQRLSGPGPFAHFEAGACQSDQTWDPPVAHTLEVCGVVGVIAQEPFFDKALEHEESDQD